MFLAFRRGETEDEHVLSAIQPSCFATTDAMRKARHFFAQQRVPP